jgi:hypothetical protein
LCNPGVWYGQKENERNKILPFTGKKEYKRKGKKHLCKYRAHTKSAVIFGCDKYEVYVLLVCDTR